MHIYIYICICLHVVFPIDITIHLLTLLTLPFSAKHSFTSRFNPVLNPNKTWAPHLWPKSCCTLQSNEEKMIDPKPRDTDPIRLILLHKSLVNSGAKTPECFGYKTPRHWRNTPTYPWEKSPTWNAEPFLGWFRYTKLDGTTTSCGHPCEAAKSFVLNGYFSTLNMALFCFKMQIITAYYCKEVQITSSWTCTTLISKASTQCYTFDVARLCPR